jgi:PAS domain S-box-containing protein
MDIPATTQMKAKKSILYLLIGGLTFLAIWLVVQREQYQLVNEPLHSTMEALEALSVLLMALFLLGRKEDAATDKLVLPALGFLGMGILNTAHAASWPGDQFVFLRAVASLGGGLGFALVWLPGPIRAAVYRTWLVWAVGAAALTLSLLSFLLPDALPVMMRLGDFSTLAITINLSAGILFIAGTARFLSDWSRSGSIEDLLFSLVGLFFGLSGLTFHYSMLWSEAWWFWHGLRLIASLLVLGLLVHRHLETVRTLKTALAELKQAENSLRRSYDLVKTIIDSMNDAISLINVRDFTIAGVNNVFLKNYGYSDESEVIGKHCYEITHSRSDVCSPPDDICPLVETVKSREHFSADHIHYDRHGNSIHVEVSTSPIKDEVGNVIQVVHVQRNITERKRAEQERERLLAELARSNKELEQFAYVASHDLQEPIRVVSSYVQLLDRKYHGKLDEKADSYIHYAVEGAERMHNLIVGLLEYSRISRQGDEFRPVDLNSVFSAAVSNLSASIRENNASITKDDLPAVSGDKAQLERLFQNLIGNSVKFRRKDVPPVVHVSAKREDADWVFSVRDNGIGIEPQYFDRVFQIFQRLHSRGEYPGTGIGLSICKQIVDRHHGRIWIESTPGQGSTFLFTIPAYREERG